jgi:hypothetical protein
MIRKFTLLASFLLLQFTLLHAQAGVAYISPSYQNISSKSFNAFAESFKTANAPLLNSSATNQPGIGFHIGGGIVATNSDALLGVEYSRARSSAEFNFANNARHRFSLHSNLIMFKMMIPIGDYEENRFLGIIDFGAGLGRAVVKSEYEPGNSPLGASILEGKYTAFHGEVSAGLSLMYMFGPVGIRANCSYHIAPFSSRLDDKDKEMDFDSLPQDYAAFNINPAVYTGDEVKDDFRYLRFGLGVVLILD